MSYRYMRCTHCKQIINVSVLKTTPQEIYLCEICTKKLRAQWNRESHRAQTKQPKGNIS